MDETTWHIPCSSKPKLENEPLELLEQIRKTKKSLLNNQCKQEEHMKNIFHMLHMSAPMGYLIYG
jgi:hypothetical protein